MYIVSKFKDYYDVMQNEKTDIPLYVRKTTTYSRNNAWWEKTLTVDDTVYDGKKSKKDLEFIEQYNRMVNKIWVPNFPRAGVGLVENCCVAFCGKLYPFYSLSRYTLSKLFDKVAWTFEEVADHLKNNGSNGYLDYKKLVNRDTMYDLGRKSWEYYKKNKKTLTVSDEVHRFFNSPIILVTKHNVYTNPKLKEINFGKMIDPYTAYQEIDMYIGNILTDVESPDL